VSAVEAPELLERVVAHAGGAERWAALERIHARVRISGLAFRAAGKAREAAEQELVVSVREPRVEIRSLSAPGWEHVYTGDAVPARRRPWPGRWSDAQAALFTGYASWHYLTFPVRLREPGVRAEALGEHVIEGERLHGLRVRFAPGTPAHAPEQRFWFTEDGALRRNDYLARMVGPFAHAANVCEREGTVDAITLPDRRRVTPQLPGRRRAPGPLLVGIAFDLLAAEPR
jgi:hypothetical protein